MSPVKTWLCLGSFLGSLSLITWGFYKLVYGIAEWRERRKNNVNSISDCR